MSGDHVLAALEALHRIQLQTNRSQIEEAKAIDALRQDIGALHDMIDRHTATRLGRFLDTLEHRPGTVWAALAILGLSMLVLSVLLIFVLDHVDLSQATELRKALTGKE